MNESYPCSIVLAAHGSVEHQNANQPLFELAESVAASGLFSTVTPAFLNGHPQIDSVIEGLPAGDVVVIPVMTSEGYYAKTVLPTRISENANLDQYRIFLAPALGVHIEISELVAGRATTLMNLCGFTESDTTIVVVGHGTRRHPNSGDATRQLGEELKIQLPEIEIVVAFIDQDPTMSMVIEQIKTPNTLAIPFLISRGPHSTVDVPEAFGLPTGPEIEFPIMGTTDNGITVVDLPVGMYPEMADLCVELAVDQMLKGTQFKFVNDVPKKKAI